MHLLQIYGIEREIKASFGDLSFVASLPQARPSRCFRGHRRRGTLPIRFVGASRFLDKDKKCRSLFRERASYRRNPFEMLSRARKILLRLRQIFLGNSPAPCVPLAQSIGPKSAQRFSDKFDVTQQIRASSRTRSRVRCSRSASRPVAARPSRRGSGFAARLPPRSPSANSAACRAPRFPARGSAGGSAAGCGRCIARLRGDRA